MFAELRTMSPVVKARTRAGGEAWLALGYAEARVLFSRYARGSVSWPRGLLDTFWTSKAVMVAASTPVILP